jgi:hypothetical protein
MMATTWSVTSQQQTTALYGTRFVRGVEIAFVTGLGHSGSVFVPQDVYSNTDQVKAMVAAAAAQMDAVGSLSGTA